MKFRLVGHTTYADLSKVYSKGTVYTEDDSKRDEILAVETDAGEPMFVEVHGDDGSEVVRKPKASKTVVMTKRGPPPGKQKTIQIGKPKEVSEPEPKAETESPDISSSDLDSEPDALV